MSPVKFITPKGPSEVFSDENHYSQAVDLGNGFYKVSGQGGWDPETGELASEPRKQVELTIENIDRLLKAGGLRGWEDVYYIRSYHIDITSTLPFIGEFLKKRIPRHRPGSVAVGVTQLAVPTMKLEIEVDAKRQSD